MRPFAKQIIADLAPLWVAGLAVLQIFLLSWTLPLKGEPYEWAQYLLLGAGFPILVLLLRLTPMVQATLALGCVLPIPLLFCQDWGPCLVLGTGQVLLLLVLLRQRIGNQEIAQVFPAQPSGIVVGVAVAVLSWLVVSRWLWWSPFSDWLTGSPYAVAVGLGAFLLATCTVVGLCIPVGNLPRRLGWLANLPALALFAFFSTHVYGLGMRDAPGREYGYDSFHHWAAIVESSDLVRQGGWLLWNVPTQYGFLNTLLVAWLPFGSVWQSFYTCNAVLLTLSAFLLFWLLRSLRPGLFHYVFSLLATVSAVFLIPGWIPGLTGPFVFPSCGAYRFIWCYVLLALLARDYQGLGAGSGRRTTTLWLGCLAWLAGTLWSAESAIYCSCIWVPAYFLLVLRRSFVLDPRPVYWRHRLPGLLTWLVLPVLLLLTTVILLCGVYQVALGHLPEGRCFVEYCLVLDFFALPINPFGAVGVLLMAFLVSATAGAYCLRDRTPLQPLPLVVGAAAALWAVSSYFVGRSHDCTVTSLSPLVMASIAATLRVLDCAGPNETWSCWIKVSLLPVFTVLLVLPLANPVTFGQYLRDTAEGYRLDMTQLLPDTDPALQQLLTQAAVEADTPIAFFDNRQRMTTPCPRWRPKGTLESQASTRAWLPAGSTVLITPLTPERRHVYFSRFIARTRLSGYLIRPKTEPRPELAWILEEVKLTHIPGRTLSNAQWTMTWFEYNPKE